jgi:hypothetical protein
MQKNSHFSISNFLRNIKISVGCEKSSFNFREFWCSEPLLQINRRIREKNLVEILGPMVEILKILGCFRMECPLCVDGLTFLYLFPMSPLYVLDKVLFLSAALSRFTTRHILLYRSRPNLPQLSHITALFFRFFKKYF